MHVINNSRLNLIIVCNFQGKGEVARPLLTKGKEDNDDIEDNERMYRNVQAWMAMLYKTNACFALASGDKGGE